MDLTAEQIATIQRAAADGMLPRAALELLIVEIKANTKPGDTPTFPTMRDDIMPVWKPARDAFLGIVPAPVVVQPKVELADGRVVLADGAVVSDAEHADHVSKGTLPQGRGPKIGLVDGRVVSIAARTTLQEVGELPVKLADGSIVTNAQHRALEIEGKLPTVAPVVEVAAARAEEVSPEMADFVRLVNQAREKGLI